MADETTRHNALAGDLVTRLIRGTIGSGGDEIEAVIVLESVIVGVSLAIIRLGGDGPVLDVVMKRAKERLAELRLKDIKTEGSA